MKPSELPDYAAHNRALWSVYGRDQEEWGRAQWATDDICWGIFRVARERRQRAARAVRDRRDRARLWNGLLLVLVGQAGARVVGVDVNPDQLERARGFQREFELEFPLIEANAEDVELPDGSFDLAVSEYGASTWCDPYKWVPEAKRLLRPGGLLVFLRNSTLLVLCSDAKGVVQERLERPQPGLYRIDWVDDEGEGTEFQLSHGHWVDLLHGNGFAIERLVELYAPRERPPIPSGTSSVRMGP